MTGKDGQAPRAGDAQAEGARPRILVADDDAVDRRIVRRALRGTPLEAGADFAEAETGAQALELLRRQRWSCVLLDHRLPDMDALELLRQLQGPDGEVALPVVIVTGLEDVALAVEAMRRGARDYLVKDSEGRYQALMPAVVQRVIHEEALRQDKLRAEAELHAHRQHLAVLVAQRTEALQHANRLLQEDIAERRRVERALHRERQRAEVTLEAIGDAVFTADADSRLTYLNPAAEALTGWPLAAVAGRPLGECLDLRHPDGTPAGDLLAQLADAGPQCLQLRLQRRDRSGIVAAVRPSALRDPDGRASGLVLVVRDVTEEHRRAEQLAHQARHDALTGLVNRAEFERRVRHAMEGLAAHPAEHVLCLFDLDRFKPVNDEGGHAAGDELLRRLAQRMSARLRARDTLARLGGDEFGCLFEHCGLEQGVALATDLLEAIRSCTLLWHGRAFSVTASMGVAALDRDTPGLEALFQAADAASYAAKAAGRNRVRVARPAGDPPQAEDGPQDWGNRLLAAMREGGLQLYRQPIHDLPHDREPFAFEVLLRLVDQGRQVPAAVFMPAVARHRLGAQLDRWVIRETLAHLAREPGLGGAGGEAGPVYLINLSEASLKDPGFLPHVAGQLRSHRVPAARIGFEIGERLLLGHLEDAGAVLHGVKALGCRIALDDFADALPHLAALRELAPDYLKIRGELVRRLGRDAVSGSLVESISRVGHAAGIHCIAQWPQDEEALRTLQRYGVDHVQGDLVQAPYPLAGHPSTGMRAS